LCERNAKLYCNRKRCISLAVFDTHYFTFTRQVNRMNSLFSLDAYDEAYRCMLRNH